MASTSASRRAQSWVERHFPEDSGRPTDPPRGSGGQSIDIAPSGPSTPPSVPQERGAGWDPAAWEEFDNRPA